MHKMIFNTAAALTLALGVFVTTAPATAAVVNYDFKVVVDASAPVHGGQTFLGSFAYDDSMGSTGLPGETLYELTGFSFDFNGTMYGVADLLIGAAAVFNGTVFGGVDVDADVFAMRPASGGSAPFFAFDLGDGDSGNGAVDFTQAVSEPTSAALALAALALLGLRRRKSRG